VRKCDVLIGTFSEVEPGISGFITDLRALERTEKADGIKWRKYREMDNSQEMTRRLSTIAGVRERGKEGCQGLSRR
jgi:hypothetical protein